jgi:hypothetical protein
MGEANCGGARANRWRRAVTRGAPSPALADLTLTTLGGARTWHFEIVDRSRGFDAKILAFDLPDDC